LVQNDFKNGKNSKISIFKCDFHQNAKFQNTFFIIHQKTDNGNEPIVRVLFRAPKCINPENFIQFEALLETRFAKISLLLRILHKLYDLNF
jgi:hypothetical protein